MSRTSNVLRHLAAPALGLALFVASAPAAHAQQARAEAPEFQAGEWINTKRPITLGDLKGKVVLLDFWTFG